MKLSINTLGKEIRKLRELTSSECAVVVRTRKEVRMELARLTMVYHRLVGLHYKGDPSAYKKLNEIER